MMIIIAISYIYSLLIITYLDVYTQPHISLYTLTLKAPYYVVVKLRFVAQCKDRRAVDRTNYF